MSKRELHHKPEPGDRGGDKNCCRPNCNCRYSSAPIWFLYVLITIFVIASPFIFIISINIWYQTPKPLPPYVIETVQHCASKGSVHDHIRALGPADPPRTRSRNWLRGGGQHPDRDLPPDFDAEICHEIKQIIHQGIDYCEDCGEKKPPEFEIPLVLGEWKDRKGTYTPTIKIGDVSKCTETKIEEIDIQIKAGSLDYIYKQGELDLPESCQNEEEFKLGPNNNRRLLDKDGKSRGVDPTREWELLERPRVHHARTIKKPTTPDILKNPQPDDFVGGPYVVFIAKHLAGICCDKEGRKAVRDKERVTIFVLYVDWVTEQPTTIEFDVEVERGKDIVSEEDTVQLVSNVRLDSMNRQITFQVGQGARRIVVAGYDFSGESTSTDTGRQRRSDQDTSGSYRIYLSGDAAVEGVERLP